MSRISFAVTVIVIVISGQSVISADDSLKEREARWLELLREQIPSIKESEQRYAIAMTVATLAETGRDTEAMQLAVAQSLEDTRDSLLVIVADLMARRAKFESAFVAISKISIPAAKEKAKSLVAQGLVDVGELERAAEIMKELTQVSREGVLVSLCEYLARNGKFEDSLAYSNEIKNAYRKSQAVKSIERMRDGTPSPLEQLTGSLHDNVQMLTAFSQDGAYDSVILAIIAAKAGDHEATEKHIEAAIGEIETLDIPPKKFLFAILAATAFAELGDQRSAGDLILKVYEQTGQDWSKISTTFGTPILVSLLVRLERLDAIDQILKKRREEYNSDTSDFTYLSTLQSVAASLVEQGLYDTFESRLTKAITAEEKCFLLLGALTGACYARDAAGNN
ncbi:MAG: hypothetical protein U0930_15575 [Pirellulales bacterium]